MASSTTLYPLAAVLNQLSAALSTQQSGIFLIATEQNTSCRFAIERGLLTHCTHSREQGKAAVLSLLQIQRASCSFSANLLLPFRAEAAVEHEFCLQILDLQPVSVEHGLDASLETVTLDSKSTLNTPKQRNRFYRGGYALGEQGAAV